MKDTKTKKQNSKGIIGDPGKKILEVESPADINIPYAYEGWARVAGVS